MARVKIQPGGKLLIAVVVLGALLFLFFEFRPSTPRQQQSAAEIPTQPSQQETPEAAEPATAGPDTTASGTTGQVEYADAQGSANTPIRIYFGFNRVHINKNVYCIFDKIQSLIDRGGASGIRIVVEGNADSIGTSWYNVKLSKKRAARVADSLSRRLGVPLKNITLVANGSSRPIASNSTAAGRADNRRTDVLIYR